MATRLPTREWTTTVEGINDGLLGNTTRPFAIVENTLWYGGTQNATNGFDSLIGISVGDGSTIAEIEVRTLLSISSGAGAFANGDIGVDHNNYLWLNTQANGLISGRANYIVVDPVNRSIVASIGTSATGTYNTPLLVPDRENQLMWVVKNSTTLEAFNTSTYASSHTIAGLTTANITFAVNEDRDELWVYDESANTLKTYRSSTGALLSTISGAMTTGTPKLVSIPEKKIMMLVKTTSAQIFSTETYTLLGTITPSGSDTFALQYYSPNTNEIYGYHLSGSTKTVVFYDADLYTLSHNITVTGTLVYAGVTGTDGAIYIGATNASTNDDLIHKIVLSVVDRSVDTGASSLFTDIPDIFNRELIFDLDLGAFYVNDIGHTGYPAPVAYVEIPGFAIGTADETIMVGNDVVLVTAGDTVILDGQTTIDRSTEPRGEQFKYVALSGTNFTLVEYRDFSFKDFVSYDSVGKYFDSYIVTGYDLSNDMMRKKRTIYLVVYNERTETIYTLDEGGNVVLARQSGCLVQPQWDWNTSMAQGKWGQQFQAYRMLRSLPTSPSSGDELDYGERVIITKNKLRGSGRTLSLLFRSQDGKDMKLLGWALDGTKQDIV